jgi:hypothetical protein
MRPRPTVKDCRPWPCAHLSASGMDRLESRRLLASVSGIVFDDTNGDGVLNAAEPALSGCAVYVDLNGNGFPDPGEPNDLTDATGFAIGGLAPGSYTLRQDLPGGWVHTAPAGGGYTLTVAADSDTITARDFGRFRLNTFSAQVYHDTNGDGRKDVQEFGLSGWQVFADRNASGTFDAGEPTALTDAEGLVTLGGIGPGATVVRVVTPAGWVLPITSNARYLTPRSGAHHAQSFPQWDGIRVRSRLMFDANADRVVTNDQGLGGRWVYIDMNWDGVPQASEPITSTDADGEFGFIVQPGTYIIRPLLRAGDQQTVPEDRRLTVVASSGAYEALPGPLGIYRSGSRAGLFGHAFDDRNRNGTLDLGEAPAVGRVVYIDANDNGQRDATEQAVSADGSGRWGFPEIEPGTYVVRQVLPEGSVGTTGGAGGAVRVTLTYSAHVVKDINFGSAEPGATAVVNRRVFYNGGNIDRSARLTPADDQAIDLGKTALLPGQRATLSNITSYTRGINGVMIDVARLPAGRTLSLADFSFKAGRTGDPSTWADAPAPAVLSVRRGGGMTGPDRVALVWADGALRNTWLQVTLRATAASGLAAPDVFYFGNLVGATGASSSARQAVGAVDYAAARRAVRRGNFLSNPHDHNRDGLINALDVAAVRANIGRWIALLTV